MSSKVSDRTTMAALNASQSLSPTEQKMLQGLSGDDYKRAHAQLMLQKQSETVNFVTNILKNNTTMSVLANLK
ncbi:hypothetical protein [Corallococcus llansteffanensis]|uniref:Uncharacterized protein n=1 Tax=Corallococcus llansteffanensis TaxID=2316731 RepID=A0A3A8Q825_9BACT|nr:hypothetical protein [Corallococcus llansteffanensis]RKH62375.1 hypothetical protein D7V93_10225 [Corallococcus llansteffanensis]